MVGMFGRLRERLPSTMPITLTGAAVDERNGGGKGRKQDRNLPGQKVRHRRAAAAIRHVHHVDPGPELEKLARDVMDRVGARASERELAGKGVDGGAWWPGLVPRPRCVD